MRGFRAKDADRDRYVEVIEAAYVDGQLGDADRELRVSRALSAETLDELETLTRDLQVPAGFVPAADRPTPPRRSGSGSMVVLLVAGFVVFIVLGAVGALTLFAASDGPDSATSQGVAVAPEPVVSGRATPVPAPFAMTAPQVRAFLRAYERKFGTLDAWEVGFHPERVGVQVPVSRARKRFERWSWDGTWRQDTQASAVIGQHALVDLGTVDVRRMFENIALARKTLDVPTGRLSHVLVNDWGQGPSVNIYISNRFNETGYLRTAPDGEIIRSYPFGA
jgi:hypothetical protein